MIQAERAREDWSWGLEVCCWVMTSITQRRQAAKNFIGILSAFASNLFS